MKYQKGSLRQVKRQEGMTWLFRFQTTKDGRRVENTARVGLVSDFPSESSAQREVDRLGLRAEINKDAVEIVTFGVLALKYLETDRDHAVVHYIKKVMI